MRKWRGRIAFVITCSTLSSPGNWLGNYGGFLKHCVYHYATVVAVVEVERCVCCLSPVSDILAAGRTYTRGRKRRKRRVVE